MTTVVMDASLVQRRLSLLKELSDSLEAVSSVVQKLIRKTSLKGRDYELLFTLMTNLLDAYKTLYIQATHRVCLTEKTKDSAFQMFMVIESLKLYIQEKNSSEKN